ncbi:hypothetical protein BH10CYA1_BH10CYA1_63710 [soil metagenome]
MSIKGDGGGDNPIPKVAPAETFKIDLSEYRGAEGRHNAGDIHDTGSRLKEAATAFENTLKQTSSVEQMAEEIKKGTPGTPAWDELMTRVEAQLKSNDTQAMNISNRTSQIPEQIASVQTTDKHLPNPYINMNG